MLSKSRGQVEVQFNWIFVLIVGAIILGFFISIVMNQQKASEEQIKADFFVSFEKVLTGVSAVEGKFNSNDVPNMELRYDCTDGCSCAAYSGSSRAKAGSSVFEMNDKIIFSPNYLKGNRLLTWTKEWTFPFRITNFVFMTSPEEKYLIEESARGQQILYNLPDREIDGKPGIDKDLFTTDSIPDLAGNYKVKFVFTNSEPETFSIPDAAKTLPDEDVIAIKIIPPSEASPEKIAFYRKNTDVFEKEGETYLFGDTSLYAAIFADNVNSYSCMMNRASRTLSMVSSIYMVKDNLYLTNISNLPDEDPQKNCRINYDNIPLGTIVDSLNNFDFFNENNNAALLIINAAKTIESYNQNALEHGCPQIY